jgi:hypothetical protein
MNRTIMDRLDRLWKNDALGVICLREFYNAAISSPGIVGLPVDMARSRAMSYIGVVGLDMARPIYAVKV